MDQIPAAMDRHLDVVQSHKDGGVLLGASGLTGRYWLGSLWYYEHPDVAPDVEKCTAGVQLEAGLNDVKWADDHKVLVGLDTGGLAMWDLIDNFRTFIHLHSATEHDDIVSSISIASGRKTAVSGSYDKCVKVWDLENFTSTRSFRVHSDLVWCVQCHPTDAEIFLSCSQDGRIFLWDLRKPLPVCIIDRLPLEDIPVCLSWQPDSEHTFAVGSETGQVVVKDTRTAVGNPISFSPHTRSVCRLEFCPKKPTVLATSSEDCTAVVTSLDGEETREVYRSTEHKDFVRGLSWCGEDKFYTCGWDSQVQSHSVNSVSILPKTSPDPVVMEVNGDVQSPEQMEDSQNSESVKSPPSDTVVNNHSENLVEET